MTARLAPALLPSLLALTALAQSPSGNPPTTARPAVAWTNRNLVFLDPAHGGDDAGAQLPNHVNEKDATLALAVRLRALLSAAGINVLLAREPVAVSPPQAADTPATQPAPQPPPPPTPDGRAGAANHAHAFACLLLHATGSGSGVQVVTSPLPQSDPDDASPGTPVAWASAQAAYAAQSDHLAAELNTALARAGLPSRRLQSSVRPIDSLTCPAVAVELAPINGSSAANGDYQQRVAQAVATALQFWRGQADAARAPSPATGTGTEP